MLDINSFTLILIEGLIDYLKKNQIELDDETIVEIKENLQKEFFLSFEKQTKTPTQIINIFLQEHLSPELNITPKDLGENALAAILNWGILKAKYFES